MPLLPTLSLPQQALFTKPTKQGWLTFVLAAGAFSVALGLLSALFSLPMQTTIAMLVGGLSVGLADLLGAGAKRVGTMQRQAAAHHPPDSRGQAGWDDAACSLRRWILLRFLACHVRGRLALFRLHGDALDGLVTPKHSS